MSFSCIFVFTPSLIRMDLSIVTSSTSLTFSGFLVLFSSISLLFSFIESHFALSSAGGTSDIILSVLHVSSMFSTSSSFLELHLTSFHQASSSFLRVPPQDFILLVQRLLILLPFEDGETHIAKSSSLTYICFLSSLDLRQAKDLGVQ